MQEKCILFFLLDDWMIFEFLQFCFVGWKALLEQKSPHKWQVEIWDILLKFFLGTAKQQEQCSDTQGLCSGHSQAHLSHLWQEILSNNWGERVFLWLFFSLFFWIFSLQILLWNLPKRGLRCQHLVRTTSMLFLKLTSRSRSRTTKTVRENPSTKQKNSSSYFCLFSFWVFLTNKSKKKKKEKIKKEGRTQKLFWILELFVAFFDITKLLFLSPVSRVSLLWSEKHTCRARVWQTRERSPTTTQKLPLVWWFSSHNPKYRCTSLPCLLLLLPNFVCVFCCVVCSLKLEAELCWSCCCCCWRLFRDLSFAFFSRLNPQLDNINWTRRSNSNKTPSRGANKHQGKWVGGK